jgi:hypothetical protein
LHSAKDLDFLLCKRSEFLFTFLSNTMLVISSVKYNSYVVLFSNFYQISESLPSKSVSFHGGETILHISIHTRTTLQLVLN